MATKKKPVPKPNVVYRDGPFPGRLVYWPEGKTESMQMRCGWEYGKYVLNKNNEAQWIVTAPQGSISATNFIRNNPPSEQLKQGVQQFRMRSMR